MHACRSTLEDPTEPPDEAFFSVGGEDARIAEGYLYLVTADRETPRASDVVAASLDYVLVFVRGTVAPDSLTADYLGGVLTPGFHLLDWRATAELSDAQAALCLRCADERVASGEPDAEAAYAGCRTRRLYRLLLTPDDLETRLVFYRRDGAW